MAMANNLSIERISGAVPPVENLSMGQEFKIREAAESNGLALPPAGSQPTGGFGDLLNKTIAQVNQDQHESDLAIKELVAGRSKNIHETMLTIERADISMKLMMQVRNKLLDAYREIMRMQI